MKNITAHQAMLLSRSMTSILFFLALLLGAFQAYANETLTIAVASSLYSKMQQQAKLFEQHHDVHVRLVSGSTGRLYNQIMQGAPFDIFIAADHHRPQLLRQHGKALATYDIGQGYLGLKLGKTWLKDPKALLDPTVQHIAIANPQVAPFGLASQKFLQQQGLWQPLQAKFIYTQNALQADMLIHQGLVDAAFVPATQQQDALAWIPYIGVLLKNTAWTTPWLQFIESQQNIHTAQVLQHD